MGCCRSVPVDEVEVFVQSAEAGEFANTFELGEKLGEGSFSVVFKCVNKATEKPFAVKVVDRESLSDGDEEDLRNEVAILRTLKQHPNIMKLVGFYEEPTKFYLISHVYTGGELLDKIIAKKFYSEFEARSVVKVVLQTILHLHEEGVVHRDLKPANLILSDNTEDARIVIVDFGFAKKVVEAPPSNSGGSSNSASLENGANASPPMTGRKLTRKASRRRHTILGTPNFLAPEIVEERSYGRGVDVW